jgi:hypothetical protein
MTAPDGGGTDGGGTLSFAGDVRPLFRETDRDSMRSAFDLFDYTDVAQHADAIAGALRSGKMPCDGAWPAAQVETFQLRRVADGFAPARVPPTRLGVRQSPSLRADRGSILAGR